MQADTPKPGWKTLTLGSLGVFYRGRGGTKADARVVGVPCIRYGDLYTQHNDVIRGIAAFIAPERAAAYTSLQVGDVVFAGSGETHEEIGKAAAFLGPEPAVVGADTIIFRPGSGLDPAYLGYAVNATQAARYKARLGQGSSVIHIGSAQLRDLKLYAPPLSEQRRIAEILDTLDEAIRKTEQVIAKLQQMKQGLLHDLLTRGIDEHGELRDPERHPEQFKDSPLGRIPRGWEVDPLGAAYAGPSKNGLYKPSSYHGRGPLMVQMGGIFRGATVDFSDAERVAVSKSELQTFGLSAGDLLFGRRSLVLEGAGKCALVDELPEPSTFESSIVRVRLDRSRLRPGFAALYLQSTSAYLQRRRFIRQVAVSGVSGADIAQFPVVFPPTDEQERIQSAEAASNRRITEELQQADKLRTLKQGLMDDLLTGRVRVTAPTEATA